MSLYVTLQGHFCFALRSIKWDSCSFWNQEGHTRKRKVCWTPLISERLFCWCTAHHSLPTTFILPFLHSKAARRKKREEAAKLPEVSKDIYYEVTTDLKETFGTVKEIQNEKKEVSWDLHDDESMDEAPQGDKHAFSFSSNQESEPSGGFKFSFFGDDAVTKTPTPGEHLTKYITADKCGFSYDARWRVGDYRTVKKKSGYGIIIIAWTQNNEELISELKFKSGTLKSYDSITMWKM